MNVISRLAVMRFLGFGCLVLLAVQPASAAPKASKIAGVVADTIGTPQMGATVLVTSEGLFHRSTWRLLTNDHGRFSTPALPAGLYSVTVTLAGFLPATAHHIRLDGAHTAMVQVALGSMFSSFARLRRPAGHEVTADDWTWVLRASEATRSVLRWRDATSTASGQPNARESARSGAVHGSVILTSGADHPGSIADNPDSPTTAFVYDMGVGPDGRLVMAGQFGYEHSSSSAGLAGEWLPSGEPGTGPVTTLLVRESRLSPSGPDFRGLRISHDDQFTIGDRVSVRYGAEYLAAMFDGTTTAIRPRGEVAVQISPNWRTSVTVATRPWDGSPRMGAVQSTLDTLDDFPTLLLRNQRPVFEDDVHEELAVEHVLSDRADISASVFHDASNHTAVIGFGGRADGPDFLQDYFSQTFAYDGGGSNSTGARVVYRQKISSNLLATLIYAYAGALAPIPSFNAAHLRDELSTRSRQSLGARISGKFGRLGTKLSADYQWLDGPTVSRLDPYGDSLYHLDPYLNFQIRQPLPSSFPCHMAVQAQVGNLLAQGYVPVATNDGVVVLVPSYRYFRGGLSLQF